MTSSRLVITNLELKLRKKAKCPKRATVTISAGKVRQTKRVKPRTTTIDGDKVCATSTKIKLTSKLKRAKKVTVKVKASGARTVSKRVRVSKKMSRRTDAGSRGSS